MRPAPAGEKETTVDLFSLAILDRTVELAIEAMLPSQNPRAGACIKTIREFTLAPGSAADEMFKAAVRELTEIARTNRQFQIAARLDAIALQWAKPRKSDLRLKRPT